MATPRWTPSPLTLLRVDDEWNRPLCDLGMWDGMTIGRDETCDVRIDDEKISRLHAVVRMSWNGATVEDLGSRNGTDVNGEQIMVTPIHRGDVIRLGETLLMVHSGPIETEDPMGHFVGVGSRGLERESALVKKRPAMVIAERGAGATFVAKHIARKRFAKTVESFLCGALSGRDSLEVLFFGERPLAKADVLILEHVDLLPREVHEAFLESVARTNVQVIATAHTDVRRLPEDEFHQELAAWLTPIVIKVPPLRERLFDVPAFVAHFLGADAPRVSCDLMERFLCHEWPQNLRELRTTVSNAVVNAKLDGAEEIRLEHAREPSSGVYLRRDVEERNAFQRRILAALILHRGDLDAVAGALETGREQVDNWVDQLGFDPHRYALS